MKPLLLFISILLLSAPALAGVRPAERMADPVMEARAQALYKDLRCVVCQSQSIAESDSEIAAALRAAVRARIQAGDGDQAVLGYLQERYGDQILMKPPVKPLTWPLWFLPALFLVAGGYAAWRTMKGGGEKTA